MPATFVYYILIEVSFLIFTLRHTFLAYDDARALTSSIFRE